MSPRLAEIGRLSVWVYFADHRRPHIQVRGPGGRPRANIDIHSGEVLAGTLPAKELRAVREWVRPRRRALEDAFLAALRHEDADTIRVRFEEATDEL